MNRLPETYTAWDGTVRKWRYGDHERPYGCCYDCKRPYAAIGDCAVPDEVWEQVKPTHHVGAGLLCANCITERLGVLNIAGIQATLWSGFVNQPAQPPHTTDDSKDAG